VLGERGAGWGIKKESEVLVWCFGTCFFNRKVGAGKDSKRGWEEKGVQPKKYEGVLTRLWNSRSHESRKGAVRSEFWHKCERRERGETEGCFEGKGTKEQERGKKGQKKPTATSPDKRTVRGCTRLGR